MTAQNACCEVAIAPAIPRKGRRRRSLARRTADSIGRSIVTVLENEELATRPGLLQRLDPRVKLLSIVVLAVTASLIHSLWLLLFLVAVTVALAAASRVGVGSFLRKVWLSAGLLAIVIALPSTTALVTPGTVVVPLGRVSLTEPGLLGAATLVARVVTAAGFSLLVVWTMCWTEILHALSALRMPSVIVATLAMAHKQILTLLRTVEQVHLARESRTVSRGTTAENRSWVTERMAFVVRKSMKTADDVYDAMLSRGFSGEVRTLVRLHMGLRDWVWTAVSLAGCTGIVLVDRLLLSR
jgi:cobalt/nickel transport system permease protein